VIQYGSKRIYHFPTPSRLTIICLQGSTWGVETQTLEGAGFIENATDCELTTDELHGATRFNMETPLIYAPLDIPIINSHELPGVKAALTSGLSELEQITDSVQASRKTWEVDTLMRVSNKL
jgi:hypothetical protein